MKTNIEMAREANAMHNIIEEWVTFDYTELEHFAELVRADEREACAKVAEEHMLECEGASFGIGAAIRARGNT